MFNERLPVHIDPMRMAETGRLLEGEYALAEMERLRDALMDDRGRVMVSLEFGIDAEGIRFMTGRLQSELALECQRCLQAMAYPIEVELSLGLVRSNEAAEQLPSHYDPLLVEGDMLFLRDVVEDELLLALPLVAMHDESQCTDKVQPVESAQRNEDNSGACSKDNPFAALAALKSNGNT